MTTHDPEHVVVAGDWHGNTPWAVGVIRQLPRLLPGQRRILLHTGDFGVWPGLSGARYLNAVNQALVDVDGELLFIDGNHEDFGQLYDLAPDPDTIDPVAVHDRITWLPRGHRWTWHGRRWLALGGAVSVDAKQRTPQISWWPEEIITEGQARRAVADGPVDVVVSHDCPSTVPLRLGPPSASWAPRDLILSDWHRGLVQDIVDEVEPSFLLHGHYHLEHDTTVRMAHGDVRVTGFACDEMLSGNWRTLDVRSMDFTTGPTVRAAASR